MPDPAAHALTGQLERIALLPGVAQAATAAREACAQLRFHEALRRRIPQAAAESRVRGARASAALEGAELPVALVRDLMRGAVTWPEDPDPVEKVARGVLQATAESERLVSLVRTSPLQALARLHVAAAAGLLPQAQVGRPRVTGEECRELVDLGPAPAAADVGERLAGLSALLSLQGSVPAVVVAALAHAEVACVRPFVRGNGAVARALERVMVQAWGLDATGVAVPEVGHLKGGGGPYVGALAAYASGTAQGVGLWVERCGEAMVTGAQEGERICDAVRAGRLG